MSSANILVEDEVKQVGRSFIYSKNNNGPKFEP